jgi:error-prone DNA polymerase
MGWQNPPVPWSEIERRLSDRSNRRAPTGKPDSWAPGDGGDSPAWSRKRTPYQAPADLRAVGTGAKSTDLAITNAQPGATRYAELHCHSNFSFLDGASAPEELVEEAVRLGLQALALTDHNGFYGVVRFAEAARTLGLATVFGSELTISSATGQDPRHLVVLVRDLDGYALLGRAISAAQMAGGKGAPRITLAELAEIGSDRGGGHWQILTGCQKGAVPASLVDNGPSAARRQLDRLIDAFGRDSITVELWDHGDPLDSVRNDRLAELAVSVGVDLVATNNVHYHAPTRRRLATAVAAVGARSSLDELNGRLPAAATAHLRSGYEQQRRFARYPGVVERAADLALECAFDLDLVAPDLPHFPCPAGHDEMSWLRELTAMGAGQRYGTRGDEEVPGAWDQIDHELDIIGKLNFAGYFLIVWDIVDFCRRSSIYCQGRGSAANSAVCYALGITNADAVELGLLFERFLSVARDGPPDIDIDIESGRREEVIQYVYERYGRQHAAQVCNVITYRARSSVRDMARALGYATGQQDAFAKSLDRWGGLAHTESSVNGGRSDSIIPPDVLSLAVELEHSPRHLGIHSGGMVLCDRPIVEVCPVEWARMADRSVLQWDKDDCASAGLVKFDLLGLGMLTAIHEAVDLIAELHGVELDIAALPQDPEVYDMLCRADSIGVFQVESRAQMATLPRLRPRTFYDLVVEVALIRPGPIQGGSVHPYIRRRNGQEAVTYLHPLLEPALKKTLGVPLFQEQLMQMAIDVAGFTPAEADQLRQAMGSKRSTERMERLRSRLYAGMAERGVTGEIADAIWEKLAAFANFGFPESHSVSFAYLVYISSWIKCHYPAAFCASLLNAQPMGFYSPHSLVQDARRHGVEVLGPDLNHSRAKAHLVETGKDGEALVRLGLEYVRHVGEDLAEAIEAGQPYTSIQDLRRRLELKQPVLEALATAGALDDLEEVDGCANGDDLDHRRRQALWTAGALAHTGNGRLEGIVTGIHAPQLPGMSEPELAVADFWSTGIAYNGHPTRFVRGELDRLGVVPASKLLEHVADRVLVAGVVTHRQRPATAGGTTFLNLEDETGLINIVVSKGCWFRYRAIAGSASALLVRGRLEKNEGVVNVIAERFEPFPVSAAPGSRDFR